MESQAAAIVLWKLASSLQSGQNIFHKLLLIIMSDHGGLCCKELANQMREELTEKITAAQ